MEPIIHYLIPLVFLLLIFPKTNKKVAFSLAVLTWVVDLDFYTTLHRALTHNLLFMIIISLALYYLINKEAMYLSFYFIGSHLILDSGYPGNALFYPFYDKALYITTEVTSKFLFNFKIGVIDLAFREPRVAYLLTTQAFLFLFLIIMLLIVRYKKSIANRLKFA